MKIKNQNFTTKYPSEDRLTCLLPSDMGKKQMYETLGFVFEAAENSAFCLAALPRHWGIKYYEDDDQYYIVDEHNTSRAVFYFTSLNFDTMERILKPRMYLLTRYCVEEVNDDGRGTYLVRVMDMLEQKVVFEAGFARIGTPKYQKLLDKANEYINEHFPDWRDPLMYW